MVSCILFDSLAWYIDQDSVLLQVTFDLFRV